MHTYSLTAAAQFLGATLAELHGLIATDVVDVVTPEGVPIPRGGQVSADARVPGWVIDELLDSSEYLEVALGGLT